MTTSVPSKTVEHELDEPSFPIVHVTDLLKAFVKAVRATQMYLPNNPMHARSLEAVKDAFRQVWEYGYANPNVGVERTPLCPF